VAPSTSGIFIYELLDASPNPRSMPRRQKHMAILWNVQFAAQFNLYDYANRFWQYPGYLVAPPPNLNPKYMFRYGCFIFSVSLVCSLLPKIPLHNVCPR
jgi:hypothetical protein